MRIVWNGPEFEIRKIGPYTWHKDQRVQDVQEGELLQDMFTAPRQEFIVAGDDPVVQLFDQNTAETLALAGIPGLAELAVADDLVLAEWLGYSVKRAAGLIAKAKKAVE